MPRRKITDAPTLDDEELPELMPQQMEFVRGLLEGKTASDAYRAAFSTEGWQSSSIWPKASMMANDGKVQAWLAAC